MPLLLPLSCYRYFKTMQLARKQISDLVLIILYEPNSKCMRTLHYKRLTHPKYCASEKNIVIVLFRILTRDNVMYRSKMVSSKYSMLF